MTELVRVVVRRPHGFWRDQLRAYELVVDGQSYGRIRRGEEVRFEVAPGSHWAQARIDWTGSPRLAFHAAPGDEVVLQVEPAGNSLMLWQLLGSTTYLRLTRVA
ncbi:hypothetical protein AB0M35_27580 [Micromonospora sp. NPDC051196]|uniref:hypothetical protein n=1 Tax=Micromonospora sp. NPDC051196 TaxID=3155281 RepID=UPI0034189D4C